MKLFDFNDPFFRPLWIRAAVVVVAACWGLFEFIWGSPFWGMIFIAIAAAAFYGLFMAFDPREPDGGTKEKD